MKKDDLFEFCEEWLSAWTGNQPEKLIEFYAEDAQYVDPKHWQGLQGRDAILEYFRKLLRKYHDWVWTPIEVFPIDRGFIVKWECEIHVGTEELTEMGVDIVELEDHKITRNEVYFDRTRMMRAVENERKRQKLIR